jgi:hypothetical protein
MIYTRSQVNRDELRDLIDYIFKTNHQQYSSAENWRHAIIRVLTSRIADQIDSDLEKMEVKR